MAFMRSISRPDTVPVLSGKDIYLRAPQWSDYREWADLRSRSREFLTPWEPTWAPDDLTRHAYRRRLRRYISEVRNDQAYPFFIFRQHDGALIGGITISGVRRGVQQYASLGYWAGQPFAGRGHVKAAVRAIIPYVFEDLRLHRLQAACLPDNEPSKAVLLNCGFQQEGYARGYLRIAGVWADHLLFAILRDDPRP